MVHDGHRERLRGKADRYGIECLEQHEQLELLLGYCLKRVNTNEMAHELLDKAGSMHGVFSLSASEIKKIKGLGEHASFFLRLIGFIIERPKTPPKSRIDLSRMSEFAEYAKMLFGGTDREVLYVLLLDRRFKLIKYTEVADGSAWQIGVDKTKIARAAIDDDAAAAVLLHNHPRGEAQPTRDDLNFTVEIERTFSAVGVPLLEHIVYAEGECYPIMRRTKESATFAIEYDDVTEE